MNKWASWHFGCNILNDFQAANAAAAAAAAPTGHRMQFAVLELQQQQQDTLGVCTRSTSTMQAAVTNSANEQRARRRHMHRLPGPAWSGLGPFNVHTFHICAVHISFSMTLTGQCGKRAVFDEPCRVLHQQQQRRVCAHPQCIKESACVCAYVCVCQLICMLQLCVCVRLSAACLQ